MTLTLLHFSSITDWTGKNTRIQVRLLKNLSYSIYIYISGTVGQEIIKIKSSGGLKPLRPLTFVANFFHQEYFFFWQKSTIIFSGGLKPLRPLRPLTFIEIFFHRVNFFFRRENIENRNCVFVWGNRYNNYSFGATRVHCFHRENSYCIVYIYIIVL